MMLMLVLLLLLLHTDALPVIALVLSAVIAGFLLCLWLLTKGKGEK